jgi:hypothetical protein
VNVIGHAVEVGSGVEGVLVAPGGVGELVVPGWVVAVLVLVATGGEVAVPVTMPTVGVLVRVVVAAGGVFVAVAGVPVAQAGRLNVSFCPADRPPVLHSYWVNSEPVSFCTPTVALDPLWVTVP